MRRGGCSALAALHGRSAAVPRSCIPRCRPCCRWRPSAAAAAVKEQLLDDLAPGGQTGRQATKETRGWGLRWRCAVSQLLLLLQSAQQNLPPAHSAPHPPT